jgi:hypothetical protein
MRPTLIKVLPAQLACGHARTGRAASCVARCRRHENRVASARAQCLHVYRSSLCAVLSCSISSRLHRDRRTTMLRRMGRESVPPDASARTSWETLANSPHGRTHSGAGLGRSIAHALWCEWFVRVAAIFRAVPECWSACSCSWLGVWKLRPQPSCGHGYARTPVCKNACLRSCRC